jgi:hypothetical protein
MAELATKQMIEDAERLSRYLEIYTDIERLVKYRRILDRIHEGGNIFYDKGRFEAYKLIAVQASKEGTANEARSTHTRVREDWRRLLVLRCRSRHRGSFHTAG